MKSNNKSKDAALSIDEKLKVALVPEAEQPYPIPKNWVWTRLATGFDEVKEKTIPSQDTDLSFIGLEHLQSGGGIIGVGDSKDVKSTKTMFKAGDILYGKLRPYLNKHALVNFAGIASTDILVFRPKGVLDSRLLDNYLGLSHVVAYAQSNSKGINLPRVSPQVIKNLPVSLPPLPEQQRIAEKLESLLGKIKEANVLLYEVPEILQNFRQSVLAAAFAGRLTDDWRRMNFQMKSVSEDIGVKLASVRENEQPSSIPETWMWTRITSLADQIRGVSYNKSDTSSQPAENSILILRAGNIQDGEFQIANDTVFIPTDYVSESQMLRPGDIVIVGSSGSKSVVGKAAQVSTQMPETSFGAFLTLFRPHSFINAKYYGWFFQTTYYRNAISEASVGININNLRREHFESLAFPLPSIKEQAEIVRRIESLFNKADNLGAQYKVAMELIETLPEIILSKAFRGELVPQDPNDEPAFGLLERITFEKEKHETEKVEGTKRKKHKQSV